MELPWLNEDAIDDSIIFVEPGCTMGRFQYMGEDGVSRVVKWYERVGTIGNKGKVFNNEENESALH